MFRGVVKMAEKVKYFLGANSDKGFVSYFKQLQDASASLQLLILKGGPGSGKSTLMKRVAAYAQENGHTVEYVPCASDKQSLDAFIDLTKGFAMVDGTAPHVEDPHYPGALQHIMYTGNLWNCDLLEKNKGDIICLTERINALHSSAAAYIKGAGALLGENAKKSEAYIKTDSFYKVSEKIVRNLPADSGGKEIKRLLSAVSVGEIVRFEETVSVLSQKTVVIDDAWGAYTDRLIKFVISCASERGIGVISFPCSVSKERYEHLYIPATGLFITTFKSGIHCKNAEIYNDLYEKIEDEHIFVQRKETAALLLEKACGEVKSAKMLHDELERYYVEAMDFSKTELLYNEILDRFYK